MAMPAWRGAAEAVAIPVGAILSALVLFGLFVAVNGADPFTVYGLMYKGAFGTWFSWQNTLTRAAPLMLTALATALPARAGLIIIGGEGALVLGGLAAAVAGVQTVSAPAWVALAAMMLAGALAGALWIALAGALRQFRGVNETISSLLLGYIAIAVMSQLVEGLLRDPESRNKPSTYGIGDEHMLGTMFGSDIHWGLGFGVIICLIAWVVMRRTTFGFAIDVAGGNLRAAKLAGLPVATLVLATCAAGGAAAGIAGAVEVAAIHGRANASLVANYGYTGILVAFLARHNPLSIIPVAVLLGGIVASGGLLQRRAHLPDATVTVLQGLLFVSILAAESLRGRLWNRPHPAALIPALAPVPASSVETVVAPPLPATPSVSPSASATSTAEPSHG